MIPSPGVADVPEAHTDDVSVAEAVTRLGAEFGERLPVSTVCRTVLACRHDLEGAPVQALPELVERLARQRLLSGLPVDAR